eukprot:scaffold32651_cov112-Isochrysis_galbana.AAC.4
MTRPPSRRSVAVRRSAVEMDGGAVNKGVWQSAAKRSSRTEICDPPSVEWSSASTVLLAGNEARPCVALRGRTAFLLEGVGLLPVPGSRAAADDAGRSSPLAVAARRFWSAAALDASNNASSAARFSAVRAAT